MFPHPELSQGALSRVAEAADFVIGLAVGSFFVCILIFLRAYCVGSCDVMAS